MKWLATVAVAAAALIGPAAAHAAFLCVGPHAGCYSTIQQAVDAANDGDVVGLGPTTYAGGVVIDKSITLQGIGARETTIKGGGDLGPVLTIGALSADPADEPTVTVKRVTITGGAAFQGAEGSPNEAHGGGILVPPDSTLSGSTKLTLDDVVITGNVAEPATTFIGSPEDFPNWPICPTGRCPYAGAFGGGIANFGTLMVRNSTISNNRAGGAPGIASDTDGGGIFIGYGGGITLENSFVTGNAAMAIPPNGRFAEGGGLCFDPNTTLTMRNSSVDGNTASLQTTFPAPFPTNDNPNDSSANGGGIHGVSGFDTGDGFIPGTSATIENSTINGNKVKASDPNGFLVAFDGAFNWGDGDLAVRNSHISGNSVTVDALGTADFSGDAFESYGQTTIENSWITNNSTLIHTSADAEANGGFVAGGFGELIKNTPITGNTVTVTSAHGPVTAIGGGLENLGTLTLKNDKVSGNSIDVTAPSGTAQGGGIFQGPFIGGTPNGLTLDHTNVMGNTLTGSPGVSLSGGGVYTVGFPITLIQSLIFTNTPDNCVGC